MVVAIAIGAAVVVVLRLLYSDSSRIGCSQKHPEFKHSQVHST